MESVPGGAGECLKSPAQSFLEQKALLIAEPFGIPSHITITVPSNEHSGAVLLRFNSSQRLGKCQRVLAGDVSVFDSFAHHQRQPLEVF